MVSNIQNITKKHMLVSYREEYQADAILNLKKNSEAQTCKIEFSLELTPLGQKNVRVQILENIGYPLIPLMRALKQHISKLDESGLLP